MKTTQITRIIGCVDLTLPSNRGANARRTLKTTNSDCSKTLALSSPAADGSLSELAAHRLLDPWSFGEPGMAFGGLAFERDRLTAGARQGEAS